MDGVPRDIPPSEIKGARLEARVAPGLEEFLRPLLDAEDPAALPGLAEVKASRVRRILAGELPTPDGPLAVHLKIFRAVGLSDRARDAVRGARAVREFENLRRARDRGLPCVEPLAAGAFLGSFGARSFLVTRTVAGSPLPRAALAPECARRAGRLLRAAHDAGLHARDLHPANVLECPDGSLVLLDLTSASLANALEVEQRARALAYFCLDLDGNVRDPAAWPLLDAYGATATCVEAAARMGQRLRNRSLSAFGRRAFRPCRHTSLRKPPRGPRWYLFSPAAQLHAEARAMVDAPPPPVKSGRRGAVHIGPRLVLKQRSAAAARRLMQSSFWLSFAGVPVPEPVALRTFKRQGSFVAARLPWPNLEAELRSGLSEPKRSAAARALGEAVGRLHAHGLRNRDMKLENLIRSADSGVVFMVDLDGVRRKVASDTRGQAADLGRLLASFRQVGEPGGNAVVRCFLRGYIRSCKCLNRPPNTRYLSRLSAARASMWAGVRPSTRAGASECSAGSETSGGASTAGS